MSRMVEICETGDCGLCFRCRLQSVERAFHSLRDAVWRMRQSQRSYFTTRAISALREAQAAERHVDALLKKLEEHGVDQPRLF